MADESELDEPLIEFFKGSNIKAVQRVLARAQKKAGAAQKKAGAGKVSKKASLLGKAMNTAMSAYGRSTKNAPSIRKTAPDTGGRPYHFSYSTVAKNGGRSRSGGAGGGSDADGVPGAAAAGASGGGPAGAAKGKTAKAGGKSRRANTAEAAHQIYTERDGAVDHEAPALDAAREAEAAEALGRERAAEAGLGRGDGAEQGADVPGAGEPDVGASPSGRREQSRAFVEDAGRDAGLQRTGTEAAAQAYIEDPDKVPALKGRQSSFGTIGETQTERLAFWDLVHERESDKGGRTQTRMVLELPHEATAAQRHEIVRLFTDDLRKKGIPFWASIHAPTKSNDQRNFHAHVVCTDRPMKLMPHPETGEMVWDFSIKVETVTKCRHKITSHPYRQNRDPEMRDRGYVKKARARLSEVVNQVMEGSGTAVRYDPRSYKDMGLDVEPMRNVTRILADKLDKRSFVVMDAEWTRRMVDAEMTAASARRSEAFVKLQEAELELARLAREAEKSKAANLKLPKHRRVSPLRQVGKAASEAGLRSMAQMRRSRLATAFVDESVAAALEHVAAATSPEAIRKRVHEGEAAPDRDDLAALHAAALEELEQHGGDARLRAKSMRNRESRAEQEWRNGPPAPGHRHEGDPAKAMLLAGPAPARPPLDPDRPRVPPLSQRLADRPHIPGMPIHPGMPGYRHGSEWGADRDDDRSNPAARIKRTMDAFVQPLKDMGVTGKEFADALHAMMKELTGGVYKLDEPQKASAGHEKQPQPGQTPNWQDKHPSRPATAEPEQPRRKPQAETTRPNAGRSTGAPPIPPSVSSRVRVVTPVREAGASPTLPALAMVHAPAPARPTQDASDESTRRVAATNAPETPAPVIRAAGRSAANVPGQPGQPPAFPPTPATPAAPAPGTRETLVEQLTRLSEIRRKQERAAAVAPPPVGTAQPAPTVEPPAPVGAAPQRQAQAGAAPTAEHDAEEKDAAAAARRAEAARRRRQALLAARARDGRGR